MKKVGDGENDGEEGGGKLGRGWRTREEMVKEMENQEGDV